MKDLLREIDLLRANFSKFTQKAFNLLPKLIKPRILDIGCGSGVPTLELAQMSDGEVIRIDINPTKLELLHLKIKEAGLSPRVKAMKLSMFEIPFDDASFDLIWSEGSIREIGFERGLKEWHRLLSQSGFLVLHEEVLSSDILLQIPTYGYRLVDYLLLPVDVWWTEFYRPLENRMKELRLIYRTNLEALKLLERLQNEINLVKAKPEQFSSAFYILQKVS